MSGVGRHIPAQARRPGSFTAACDVCSVTYWDHQLRKMEDGTVCCYGPGTLNDAKGRVGLTLDRLNAESARAVAGRQPALPFGRPGEPSI